jgi:hypothetical protein
MIKAILEENTVCREEDRGRVITEKKRKRE